MEKGKAVRDGKTERKKSNSKTAAIIFKLFIIDRRYAEKNKKKNVIHLSWCQSPRTVVLC